jgi:glucose-1-phosphate thymidylyltransferase
MKLIIPMAGMGKRMRPHTLTVPKPLIKIAGKSIVQRLVEEITCVIDSKIDEIAFIVGRFGEKTENSLLNIADKLGSKGTLYYQDEALGTAHAVHCAANSLNDKVIVAFADTLFKAEFHLNEETDAVIWTKKVHNPEAFGVVKKNDENIITDFIEKPKEFVSDEAIIGIYYFKSGEILKNELQYLIDNEIKGNNEYQLTDALERMKNNGSIFKTETVDEWLDCGNKNATVYTNQRILHHSGNIISTDLEMDQSIIIEPCFIGENVKIKNSIIGPYVSIDKNSKIDHANIRNSMIQKDCSIQNIAITDSMIGSHVNIQKNFHDLNVGDYNTIS